MEGFQRGGTKMKALAFSFKPLRKPFYTPPANCMMSFCEFAKRQCVVSAFLQMRVRLIPSHKLQNGGERFPFSPEEKAGMKAGVKTQITNQFA
jgi:hypothetical protein